MKEKDGRAVINAWNSDVFPQLFNRAPRVSRRNQIIPRDCGIGRKQFWDEITIKKGKKRKKNFLRYLESTWRHALFPYRVKIERGWFTPEGENIREKFFGCRFAAIWSEILLNRFMAKKFRAEKKEENYYAWLTRWRDSVKKFSLSWWSLDNF